jgi:xylulokinase
VYEGIMQSLYMCEAILSENGLPASRLTLVGGGAKSALWAQMAADIFGVPVRVHRTPREATSLGAALTAGVGIGWYRDFAEAARQIRIQREVLPDKANAGLYRRHCELYRTLYPRMKEIFQDIYRFQQ